MTSAKKSTDKPVQPAVVAYKGFDKDWKCRGYQFEVGKTYAHKGPVKACESGFHSCEYPLDVFRYYEPASSVFALVEAGGDLSRHDEDSKIASSSITIKASIDLPGLIKAAIEYTMSRVKPAEGAASNSGDSGAASNSGTSGAASNSGTRGAASNSGYRGAASNSGYRGIAADFNGYYTKVKSCATGAIVCINRDDEGNIRHIRASKVGENGIKPDTWYSLNDSGEFVEVA